jgi:hypothetical protein
MTMNHYWVVYPRDFANEYTVYVTTTPQQDYRMRYGFGGKTITRPEAIRLGWTRPRQAKKTGEQWFGGFAGDEQTTVKDAIEEASRATSIKTSSYIQNESE